MEKKEYGYLELDENSFRNITRKPNLGPEIPQEGYNWTATNYVCRKAAERTEDCGFLDTTAMLSAPTRKEALEMVAEACMYGKTITGEVPICPEERQYRLLEDILQVSWVTLTQQDYDNRRLVVPLTINSKDKEAHGVALCIDSKKDENLVNIMILEQHAQRDGGKLDFSKEAETTLSVLKTFFESCGVRAETYLNDKPICREKGVCGIVSAEVCRRLLRAYDPMRTARIGGIRYDAEAVKKLHHRNFLDYQNDNAGNLREMVNGKDNRSR